MKFGEIGIGQYFIFENEPYLKIEHHDFSMYDYPNALNLVTYILREFKDEVEVVR